MPIVLIVAGVAVLLVLLNRNISGEEATLAQQLADEDSSGGDMTTDTAPTKGDFLYEMKPSPNQSSRGGAKVTALVWHYTAGASAAGAISWLCNPEAKASAHFVVGRDGSITQLVPLSESAWHAGTVTGNIGNKASIGVELVNPGWVTPDPDNEGEWLDSAGKSITLDVTPQQKALRFPSGLTVTKWWVPYTEQQRGAMIALLAQLATSPYSACVHDQLGHEDIASPEGRKVDPGPLFPWESLVQFKDRPHHKTTVV
jgi:N-acetylmuramoyl-L-alanine amidase